MKSSDVGVLVKQVAKFGNSAHVTLPRGLIGQDVVVVSRSELVYVSNGVGGKPGPPSIVVDGSQFVAHALNEYGEQMVFVSNRREPKPILYHSDLEWNPLALQNAAGDLVVVRSDLDEDVHLGPGEVAWLRGCLALLAVGIEDLPPWEKGESLQHQMGRALLSNDRGKQIALLEKLLVQLKAQR